MDQHLTKLSLGAVASAAVIVVGLASMTGSAYADHDFEHALKNLKGGVSALEKRVSACELGIGGACPGTTGSAGPQGAQGDLRPVGPALLRYIFTVSSQRWR